jgi:hemoglobin
MADITEDMIRDLVHAFYAKAREDALLGPIFNRVIGDDWDAHLATICDFWSGVMLQSGRYGGSPMAVHMKLRELTPQHFERWLALWAETAAEVCPPDAAEIFVARANNIARSLQMGMFYKPA